MSLKTIEQYEEGWLFHDHAWIVLHHIIREIASYPLAETILDFGAGPGIAAACIQAFFPWKKIFVEDIDPNCQLKWKKRNLNHARFSKIKIYDIIYSSHVLEHLERPDIAIHQLSEKSKVMIFVVPDGKVDDPSHKHIFNRISFLRLINNSIKYKNIRYYPIYHPHINNLMAVIEL